MNEFVSKDLPPALPKTPQGCSTVDSLSYPFALEQESSVPEQTPYYATPKQPRLIWNHRDRRKVAEPLGCGCKWPG